MIFSVYCSATGEQLLPTWKVKNLCPFPNNAFPRYPKLNK